ATMMYLIVDNTPTSTSDKKAAMFGVSYLTILYGYVMDAIKCMLVIVKDREFYNTFATTISPVKDKPIYGDESSIKSELEYSLDKCIRLEDDSLAGVSLYYGWCIREAHRWS